MEKLQTILHLRDGEARADFEKLNIYGAKLDMLPNGHTAIELLGFDEKALTRIEEFDGFWLDTERKENHVTEKSAERLDGFLGACIHEVQQKQDVWVATAVASGRTGALPRRINEAHDRIMSEYQEISMVLSDDMATFVRELFADDATITTTAANKALRVGEPVRPGGSKQYPATCFVEAIVDRLTTFRPTW